MLHPVQARYLPPAAKLSNTKTAQAYHALSVSESMPVRFSGGKSLLLPDKSLILTIPGFLCGGQAMTGLNRFLSENGQTVSTVVLPAVKSSGGLQAAFEQLEPEIFTHRMKAVRHTLKELQGVLSKTSAPVTPDAVAKFFQLNNSEAGKNIANWLVQSLPALLESARKAPEQVPDNLEDFRNTLTQHSETQIMDPVLCEKTVNKLMDRLYPRVVLMGHSMGGFVSTVMAFSKTRDVGMVIAMGTPLQGASPVKTGGMFQQLADQLFPNTADYRRDSKGVNLIQNRYLPPDVSLLSLANPKDTTVELQTTRHNETLPGRVNLHLPIGESSPDTMKNSLELSGAMALVRPALDWMASSALLGGVRHHFGFLDQTDKLFGENNLINALLLNPYSGMTTLEQLLDAQHYDPMREQMLKGLLEKLSNRSLKPEQLKPLQNQLQLMIQQTIPFTNSVDKLAQQILSQLT